VLCNSESHSIITLTILISDVRSEIGFLLCTRSKYGPDGEFNEGWKPPTPVAEAPPPEPIPIPMEEPARAPPAWRTVRERGTSRRRRQREQSAPPAAPPPVPAAVSGIPVVTQPGGHTSWATWQRMSRTWAVECLLNFISSSRPYLCTYTTQPGANIVGARTAQPWIVWATFSTKLRPSVITPISRISCKKHLEMLYHCFIHD
jgi:hypothetical protein